MAAKIQSNGMWVKFFTIMSWVGILFLIIFVAHLTKTLHNLSNQVSSQNDINNVNYKCDSGKTISAVYFDQKAELSLSDKRNLLLMQGISGSGIRYVNPDESITFWSKGNTAFIKEGPNSNVTYANCVQTTSQ